MDNEEGREKKTANTWDHAKVILADVPLDYREVKRILPWGMRPTAVPMGTLFFADYPFLSAGRLTCEPGNQSA